MGNAIAGDDKRDWQKLPDGDNDPTKPVINLAVPLGFNGQAAAGLGNALNVKDARSYPLNVEIGKLALTTDVFQHGFGQYQYINFVANNGAAVSINAFTDVLPQFLGQNAVAAGAGVPLAGPLFQNNLLTCRISNAWFRVTYATPNPLANTTPLAIHVIFLLDGNPVWEEVQNNLIAQAADFSFVAQTANSSWNGIVPAGSLFTAKVFQVNGTTGAAKVAFAAADTAEWGLIAFGVPAGAELPK